MKGTAMKAIIMALVFKTVNLQAKRLKKFQKKNDHIKLLIISA